MVYLESFELCTESRRVYPYGVLAAKELSEITFAPLTIFYGSNGSGKSTLLNIIAEKIGNAQRTLGNTSEFFAPFVRKCTMHFNQFAQPQEMVMVRSEDIMERIALVRKRNAEIDRLVTSYFQKGHRSESEAKKI